MTFERFVHVGCQRGTDGALRGRRSHDGVQGLAHLGHPWEGETIAVIRRHKNVFADLSALYYRPWQFYNSMRLLVEYRTEAKVLFGSDFPFANPAATVAGLESSGLSMEELRGIYRANALKVLPRYA